MLKDQLPKKKCGNHHEITKTKHPQKNKKQLGEKEKKNRYLCSKSEKQSSLSRRKNYHT